MGKRVPTSVAVIISALVLLFFYSQMDRRAPPGAAPAVMEAAPTLTLDELTEWFTAAIEDGDHERAVEVADLIGRHQPDTPLAEDAAGRRPELVRQRDEMREQRRLARQWTYSTSKDEMTDKPVHSARIQSTNTASFGWPYGGPHRLTLQLRTHPRFGKDAIISVPRGQMLCGFQGCNLNVRFGDGPVQVFQAGVPSDHSTDHLFIRNYSRFVGQMMKTNLVRISVPFYQSGTFTFGFEAGGFDADRYLGRQ